MGIIRATNSDGYKTICFKYLISNLFDDVSLDTLTMADKMEKGQTLADSDRLDDYGLSNDEQFQFNNFLTECHVKVFSKLLKMTYGLADSIMLNFNPIVTPAVAKQVTLTLTGTIGSANIDYEPVGIIPITFSENLTTTAAQWVLANATAYLAQGIVLSSGTGTITFTASVPGVGFADPVITHVSGDLAGAVTVVTPATGKSVTVNFTGNTGAMDIAYTPVGTNRLTYVGSMLNSISLFIAQNYAEFQAQGITLQAGPSSLTFTSQDISLDFETPTVTPVSGTLQGEVEVTEQGSKVVAIALSGSLGAADINYEPVGSLPVNFQDSLTTTAAAFVLENQTAYLAQGITLTAVQGVIRLTGQPGVDFDLPTIIHNNGNLSGSVALVRANNPGEQDDPYVSVTIRDKEGYNLNYVEIIDNEVYLALKHYILKEWYVKCLLGDQSKYYDQKYVENMKAIQKYGLMLRKPMRLWRAPSSL